MAFPAARIEKFEEKGMALIDNLKSFGEALKSFGSTPGSQGSATRWKCESVVASNPDLCDLRKIAATINGSSMANDLPCKSYELASSEYAPIRGVSRIF